MNNKKKLGDEKGLSSRVSLSIHMTETRARRNTRLVWGTGILCWILEESSPPLIKHPLLTFPLCLHQCKGWSLSLISQDCLYAWVTATEPRERDCHTLSLLSCCALYKPVPKQQRPVVLCPSVLSWVMGQLYFGACIPPSRWQEGLTIPL